MIDTKNHFTTFYYLTNYFTVIYALGFIYGCYIRMAEILHNGVLLLPTPMFRDIALKSDILEYLQHEKHC